MDALTWSAVATPAFSPTGLIATIALLVGYAWAWRSARAAGHRARVIDAVLYVVAGVLPVLVATCSGLGELRRVSLQAGAWQAALLVAVAPTGLALGRPVTLIQAVEAPRVRAALAAALRSPVLRIAAYPGFSAVMAATVTLALFLTGWYQATVDSAASREATYLILLAVGVSFVLPLLGEAAELLPRWCTPPVRVGLAALDGVADAIAGIVIMTAASPLWRPAIETSSAKVMADQALAGAILLCVAEAVGLPVLFGAVVAWMRVDAVQTRLADADDDARRAAQAQTAIRRPGVDAPAPGVASSPEQPLPLDGADADQGTPAADQPWWLSDPNLADRYRRL
ncbi:MAG: cytochrome c oxidase assembly protein [Actinobacteria bacterium]|nr:cytochrome c oxidase assembly protein [Actinomycetota bacterium]